MIRLAEFVAALLNEMAVARAKAALFSAQMAVDFRDHELLGQLPVPVFRIVGGRVTVSFAVATPAASTGPEKPPLEPPALVAAARQVAAALPEQKRLKEAFSLYQDQAAHWTGEVAPQVAERFAVDAQGALSIDGMTALFGELIKSHYLLTLIGRKAPAARIRQGVEANLPDLLQETAKRLLRRELERRTARSGTGGRAARTEAIAEERPGTAPAAAMAIDSGLYIHVDAEALKGMEHVSTMTLELEEGVVDRLTFAEPREASSE